MSYVTKARLTRRVCRKLTYRPISKDMPASMHGFFTLLMMPGSELGFQQVVKAVKACIVREHGAQLVQ